MLKKIIQELLAKVSPEIREMLKNFLLDWKAKAAATDNWYDDVVVNFIYDLLGF